MVRVLVVVLACAALGVGLLWGFQRRLVYLPDSRPVPTAAAVLGAGAREVTLRTEDGLALGAWLVGPTGAGVGVHVLVAAGNAGNRADRAALARRLAAAGLTVLVFDYRGFGGNPGRPSEAGLLSDARAARAFLLEQAGARPERLLYLGESLGAAVVTALAVEHPPAGLLLRSPFTDLASVGQRLYPVLPVRALLWDRFPLREQLAGVRAPTVVVYGGADRLVPPAQSETVAGAAPGLVRSVRVDGAGHDDPVLLAGDELVAAVLELAARAGGR